MYDIILFNPYLIFCCLGSLLLGNVIYKNTNKNNQKNNNKNNQKNNNQKNNNKNNKTD